MADLKQIAQYIIQGNAPKVKELTQQAVDEGEDVGKILNEGLLSGMSVVGERFKKNEIYIPEVLIAARAIKEGMQVIRPLLVQKGIKGEGKVIMGTVKGDLHDIGKNLVAMMLEGAGFEVIDLGVDVAPERFVQKVKESEAEIIGLSALLTTTMPAMKQVIAALTNEGLRRNIKVMIGGAPVTQEYADEIGADGYAPDAASAVDKAKQLMRG